MHRFTGHSLMGIGALHTLVGLVAFSKPLADVAQDGFVNAIDPYLDRQVAFWYVLAGVLLFALGQSCRWAHRQTGLVPISLGWTLLAIAVLGVILMPIAGFWLFFPPALFALAASRDGRARRRSTVDPSASRDITEGSLGHGR